MMSSDWVKLACEINVLPPWLSLSLSSGLNQTAIRTNWEPDVDALATAALANGPSKGAQRSTSRRSAWSVLNMIAYGSLRLPAATSVGHSPQRRKFYGFKLAIMEVIWVTDPAKELSFHRWICPKRKLFGWFSGSQSSSSTFFRRHPPV